MAFQRLKNTLKKIFEKSYVPEHIGSAVFTQHCKEKGLRLQFYGSARVDITVDDILICKYSFTGSKKMYWLDYVSPKNREAVEAVFREADAKTKESTAKEIQYKNELIAQTIHRVIHYDD
jgi:hypothetical protein